MKTPREIIREAIVLSHGALMSDADGAGIAADNVIEALRPLERERRRFRKAFRDYTDRVKEIIVLLDDTMKQSDSVARGKRIAYLTNQLEFQTDCERRFRLNLDFNGRPFKKRQ